MMRGEAAADPVPAPELDAPRLRERLVARAGVPAAWRIDGAIEVVATTGSTNADLVALGRRAPRPSRRLLVALDQTAGRGRHGREWLAGAGQLTFSIGLALDVAAAALAGFALLAGLAVRAALAESGVAVALKWPNDIVASDGAKLGGLLVELVAQPGGASWVVLGIGINRRLGEAARARLAERVVTDLHALGGDAVDPADLIAAIVAALESRLPRFLAQGFEPFRAEFDAAHLYHGREVAIGDGDQRRVGRFRGVGAGGEAGLVDQRGGERQLLSGELSLRPGKA